MWLGSHYLGAAVLFSVSAYRSPQFLQHMPTWPLGSVLLGLLQVHGSEIIDLEYPLRVSTDLKEKGAQDYTRHHSLDPEEMRHSGAEAVRSL